MSDRPTTNPEALPASEDIERLVLGAAQVDVETMAHLRPILESTDFVLRKHRQVWGAACALFDRGLAVDRITLYEELRSRGEIENVGGLSYLAELDTALRVENIPSYVHTLKDKALRRRVLISCESLSKRCFNGAPTADIIESAARLLTNIDAEAKPGLKLIRSVDEVPFIRDCGASDINYINEPVLAENAVTALTGDSGSGKSSLGLALCGAAISVGRPVLILDRENPLPVISERLTRLHVEDGTLLRYWGGWLDQQAPAPGSPLVLDWIRKCQPRPIVVVDSLVAFHGGDENDAGETRTFMDQCRRAADVGAAVVVIHHTGKADTSKDYRGSSDFKASVDIAFQISNLSSDGRLGTLRLRCFKSRFGFTGDLVYTYANGRFIRDNSTGAGARSVTEQLTELLRQHARVRGAEFETLAVEKGLGRNRARQFLIDGGRSGVVCVEKGEHNTRHYALASNISTDGEASWQV